MPGRVYRQSESFAAIAPPKTARVTSTPDELPDASEFSSLLSGRKVQAKSNGTSTRSFDEFLMYDDFS